MGRYAVRFQVQQGRYLEIASEKYNNQTRPCSKKDALRLLDALERRARSYQGKKEWAKQLSQAIGKAKAWVSRINNMDATHTHTVEFEYERATYRVDIEVKVGEGHFT